MPFGLANLVPARSFLHLTPNLRPEQYKAPDVR